MKTKYEKIVTGVKKYFDESGFSKAVIGLSGGIDSSLSAKLVADAIGCENVLGLILLLTLIHPLYHPPKKRQ